MAKDEHLRSTCPAGANRFACTLAASNTTCSINGAQQQDPTEPSMAQHAGRPDLPAMRMFMPH